VLFRLEQKYGPGTDRVIATGEEARRELGLLDTAGTDLANLARQLGEARNALAVRCRALTSKRTAAARRLAKAVTAHLAGLGMPDGRFRVGLEPLASPARHGAEAVEFVVQLNPGMGEGALARAASGGELSRVMLAIKAELARHDAVPTLVFDEVDQGIGGHVAGRLAAALSRVADAHQVVVITHLPQVAAAAVRHLVVAKAAPSGVAEADVRCVAGEERVEEIARMLGGEASPETARRHAAELLKKAAT
jgi:DNA repair protein RecN (Recombination protein N)